MNRAKPLVIINPAAGSIEDLEGLLERLRILNPAKLHVTRRKGEAKTVAQNAIRGRCDFIIVAGGDGTLNEVINAIAQSRRSEEICLGLIPLGTGNDFARSFGMPSAIEDNIDILRSCRTTLLDLIRVKGERVRYFANISAGGFSGAVDERLTSQIKRAWGPLSYVRSAVAALPDLLAYRCEIVFDNHAKLSRDVYNIIVANGRFVAGGLPIAPKADPQDGLADVILIPACPIAELALLAGQILLGQHIRNKAIVFRRGAKIKVRSRPKMHFNVDGEPVGSTPIVFQVMPKALNFVIK